MKRTEAKSFAEIFDGALETAGLTDTYREQKASFLWPEIVGQEINRHTSRRYVEHGELHVYITSAVLKNELSFLKSRIIALINEAAGAEVIHRIVIH